MTFKWCWPAHTTDFKHPLRPPMSLTTSKDTLPTSSHALAAVDEDEILTLDSQAGNLGWNKSPDEMANPIIEGIENDEVWMLLRRFNKLLFHVKAVDNVAGDLDLQFRTDDDFEPDKLCANIERFYMTIVREHHPRAVHMNAKV